MNVTLLLTTQPKIESIFIHIKDSALNINFIFVPGLFQNNIIRIHIGDCILLNKLRLYYVYITGDFTKIQYPETKNIQIQNNNSGSQKVLSHSNPQHSTQ